MATWLPGAVLPASPARPDASQGRAARLSLEWFSAGVRHVDVLHFNDWGPKALAEALGLPEDGPIDGLALGIASRDEALVRNVARTQFGAGISRFSTLTPESGRWYPSRFLNGEAHGGAQFQVLDVDAATVRVDCNHPLASRALHLRIEAAQSKVGPEAYREPAPAERLSTWLAAGPGLQARNSDAPPAFFTAAAIARDDEHDDALFYAEPRLVQHIDAYCRAEIQSCYQRALRDNGSTLDLMSSWVSHLPATPAQAHIAGIGMNQAELAANPRLAAHDVQDLNANPCLPYAAASFDTVICTVSVEYLTRPHEVFAEVARVLKPGGRFLNTFSERWFAPKAIRVWAALHPFERLHLVTALYHSCPRFKDVSTWSLRGVPRPPDDDYVAHTRLADPVYVVSGTMG